MNLQNQYLRIAKEFIKPFIKDSNIVGINLSGGISRGTGDEFSELDINFYVKNKKKKGLPPEKDINVNGVWFDFHIFDFEKEKKKEWEMSYRWDSKNSRIMFDRNNFIKKLFRDKTMFKKGERERLIKELSQKFDWSIQLSEIFEVRRDLINAHLLVNQALDTLIDIYFLKNGQLIPHFKWKYNLFSKLRKPNQKFKKEIFHLFLIKNFSSKELKKRINKLKSKAIQNGLKDKYSGYHKQNLQKIRDFSRSIKKEIKYEGFNW